MSFIQVSKSTSSALDLGTAVRTYSKSFVVYQDILVDTISVKLRFNININTSSMFQIVRISENDSYCTAAISISTTDQWLICD